MYWVGGTGNWSDATNHWATTSGGSPGAGNLPTATDDAIFDANSNTSNAAYTVTLNSPNKVCKDLNFSAMPGDGAGGTITWAGTQAVTISGSLTCLAGMTRTYTGAITFNATSTGKTITLNGVTLASAFTFNGVGGGWTLQDALTTTGNMFLSNGELDTNGVAVSASTISIFGSPTLTLGASSVTLTGTFIVLDASSTTVLNAGTSTLKLTGASGNKGFNSGGLVYNNIELTGNATGKTTFTNSPTFNDIKYMSPGTAYKIEIFAGHSLKFATWTGISGTSGNLFTIKSTSAATHTLQKLDGGTISGDYLSIDHSIATVGTFYAGANSTDGGSNTGWNFSAAPAHPVSIITQLRPQMATGRRYGSFAGRPAANPGHPVGRLTQLHPQMATGRRYGSFAGKPDASGGGSGLASEWIIRNRRRGRR